MAVTTTQLFLQQTRIQAPSKRPTLDLQQAGDRAVLLRKLGEHRDKFSVAERDSYDALRDECIRLARKQGNLKKAEEYVRFLERFLQSESATAVPPVDLPVATSATPTRIPLAVAPKPAMLSSSEKKASDHTALRFVERSRIGRVHASAPASSNTPASVAPAPKRTYDVPQSTPKRTYDVLLGVPSVEIADTVPVSSPSAEVLKEEMMGEIVAEASDARTEKASVRTIAKEVEAVNAELNAFADGKAFQWLHSTESGYREYMQELMALRSDLMATGNTDTNADALQVFETRLSALKARALAVESAVGKKRPEPAETVSPVLPPEKVTLESPLAPQPWKVVQAPARATPNLEPSEPLNIETKNPVLRTAKEGADTQHIIENKAAALNDVDVATSIPEAEALQALAKESAQESAKESPNEPAESRKVKIRREVIHEEVQVPAQGAQTETQVETQAETNEVSTPEPMQEPIQETSEALLAMPSETPPPSTIPSVFDELPPVHLLPNTEGDPNEQLYSRDVEDALDDLLTKWLGGRGWLGLKKGGVEHPEWLVMATLRVQDVIENDGYVPEGLTHELMQNLDANVREWGLMYHIPLAEYTDKTISELMHRIVFESLNKQDG